MKCKEKYRQFQFSEASGLRDFALSIDKGEITDKGSINQK
jgi:hypothetical protein